MEKQMKKTVKLKVSEIRKSKKTFPRFRFDYDAIRRYFELYRQGKSEPILVQKATNVLIDGFHRLEALNLLDIKEVEVEEVDIPESELLAEAIRRNVSHGVPLSLEERNNCIIKLRFDFQKSIDEIADIVQLHPSSVSRVIDKFSKLYGQETKLDLRRKAETEKVVKAFLKGKKQNDVAREFGLTEGRISQILKDYHGLQGWREKGQVNIIGTRDQWRKFFKIVLANEEIENGLLQFKKEGIAVLDSSDKIDLAVNAFFSLKYFEEIDIKNEFDGLLSLADVSRIEAFVFRTTKADLFQISFSQIDKVKGEMTISEFKGTSSDTYTCWYGVGDRVPSVLPGLTEVDENNFPKRVDVVIKVSASDFEGIPKEEHTYIELTLKDDMLRLVCRTKDCWEHTKTIKASEVLKTTNEEITLALDALRFRRIASVFDPFKLGLVRGKNEDYEVVIVGGTGENYYGNIAFMTLERL